MSQETPLPPDAAKLKEELEAKAAEIRAKAGAPPEIQIGAPPPPPVIQMPRRPMPPIPDHIGAAARPEMPLQRPMTPEEFREGSIGRDRIGLDAAKGSELHLLSLQAQLLTKETEKAALRQEVAKRDSKIAELERQLIAEKANEQQRLMAERMREYGVPDGWTFTRNVDATYTLERPKNPAR